MSNNIYTIKLYDTKSDGWNNNYITIRTEKNIIIEYLTLSYNDKVDRINTKEFTFTCGDATTITIDYHNDGFYPYENYYILYLNNRIVYASDFGNIPENSVVIHTINSKGNIDAARIL